MLLFYTHKVNKICQNHIYMFDGGQIDQRNKEKKKVQFFPPDHWMVFQGYKLKKLLSCQLNFGSEFSNCERKSLSPQNPGNNPPFF